MPHPLSPLPRACRSVPEMSPGPGNLRPRSWLALTAVLFLGGALFLGGGLSCHRACPVARDPALVIALRMQPNQAARAQALRETLQETFAFAGALPVFPASGTWEPGPRPYLALDLVAEEREGSMEFRGRWGWIEPRHQVAWQPFELPALPPRRALEALAARVDLPLDRTALDAWLPQRPEVFWAALDLGPHPASRGRAEALARLEPPSGLLMARHARALRQALWDLPEDGRRLWEEARDWSARAVAKAPESPAALAEWAHHAIHAGEGRTVLPRLLEIQRRNPRSPDLAYLVSYAARYAGRLDLATAALDRQAALDPRAAALPPSQTARLYAGDLEGFERGLGGSSGGTWRAYGGLQRGRLALFRGDRNGARGHFQRAWEDADSHRTGRDLAGAYLAALGERPSEAPALIQGLERQRRERGLCDGELVLMMSEAAALAGDASLAQDLADQAYTEGFSCSRWFRKNPLLESLRGSQRWEGLLQRVREREALVKDLAP